MYIRPVHAEHHLPTLHAFVRSNPLGILTTAIDSSSHHFLQSSHIPWLLDDGGAQGLGVLRGHIARANPQAKVIIEELTNGPSQASAPRLQKDVLVLFNGPAHHYVTPKFYTETKPSTGKVVPTWDYAAVQVYGRATVYFDTTDPATDAYLTKQVSDLSQFAEGTLMGYNSPWKVSDAPSNYIELLKKAIIGIEIEITDIAGRWKMGQELPEGDREGVVKGFEQLGTPVAQIMAQTVRERAELAEARKKAQV
ncbi:uncharacterized protein PHACADRAFT_248894 [Phanerochaete carnosa HHB-10118-sp]|uniref:Transcriptional regulator n=1 Tax=Phanerochaete carnosa (strain HHB-10118-sp) TaxID=650164 RepID=K5WIA8_PHACS|nr:uncharacterized protein PHACADRAFT_248894 [Phanerochaete carnosa HHB-10118-sp]EKM58814.1 hypothetical protein PHACADRAFT_248894 [Phanerochaete carnosa HHB-10118-sp]